MRLRLAAGRREESGFTLIELLVVIIIIGILAAIAVPVFLSQRQKAVDASSKSDLHNLATQIESWAVDNPTSGFTNLSLAALSDVKSSKGVALIIFQHNANGYCLGATSTNGSPAPPTQPSYYGQQVIWWYDSQSGGLQPRNVTINSGGTGCAKTTGFSSDWVNNIYWPT